MPATKKRSRKINLLPREEFLTSTAGRIFAWILSTFRIIVIVTEILVMLAFLSRFWLDAQNTDLNELLLQKQAVLAAALDFENEFKDTQARLYVFNEYAKDEQIISDALNVISSSLPPDIFLGSIAFNEKAVSTKGTSPSEAGIQQFIVNLSASDKFFNVTLVDVKSEQEGFLAFSINFVLRE
jgi:Tfp pilus assembly protein PilN